MTDMEGYQFMISGRRKTNRALNQKNPTRGSIRGKRSKNKKGKNMEGSVEFSKRGSFISTCIEKQISHKLFKDARK